MTACSLRRYVVAETAVSIAVNTIIGMMPVLVSLATAGTVSSRSLHHLDISLAPQLLMGALMSALVPSLLTRRRQNRGPWMHAFQNARPTVGRTLAVAAALAALFMVLATAFIHFVLPLMVGNSLGSREVVALTAAQAALSGAFVTPVALTVLFGIRWTTMPPPATPDTHTDRRNVGRSDVHAIGMMGLAFPVSALPTHVDVGQTPSAGRPWPAPIG